MILNYLLDRRGQSHPRSPKGDLTTQGKGFRWNTSENSQMHPASELEFSRLSL